EKEVATALSRMSKIGRRFLMEPMIDDAIAEVIVGVKRDPVLGLALVIGAGGLLTNLLEDSVSVLLPVSRADLVRDVKPLKIMRVIEGYRGGRKGDAEALVSAILAIAAFANDNADQLLELDVNPILVRPEGFGVVAVDAFISEKTKEHSS
ncbi:MAG: acetate--CoA ligase family protein, partial [Kiloniellales bacterium]|nr:acetate--CoA ligase family protein [Kiloniellales bacterium]